MANIVVKISLDEDIHRIRLTLSTFEQLQQLVEETFSVKKETVIVKYIDNEGDKITISSDRELREALLSVVSASGSSGSSPLLRLYVTKKVSAPQPVPPQFQGRAPFDLKELLSNILGQVVESVEVIVDNHSSNKQEQATIHTGVICDNCKASPIVGNRFKCTNCPDYDLCNDCMQSGYRKQHAEGKHVFQNFTHPRHQRGVSWGNCPRYENGSCSDKPVHIYVRCDGCNASPIVGNRHKCEQCADFDLCDQCIDNGLHKEHAEGKHTFTVANRPHFGGRSRFTCPRRGGCPSNQEPSSTPSVATHFGVECDGCGAHPIIGVRHKCVDCDNYDLCTACKDKGVHSHHTFRSFDTPVKLCCRPGWNQRYNVQTQKEEAVPEKKEVIEEKKEAVIEKNEIVPEKKEVIEEKKEDFVVIPAPEPAYIYAQQLEEARQMGFVNDTVIKSILERNHGDLLATVTALLEL